MPEPHNTCMIKLLFDLAHWHGLAKLRMHTDSTLEVLSQLTTNLGDKFRSFQEQTRVAFQTRELERERAARMRRQGKNATTEEVSESSISATSQKRNHSARQPKQLNLRTYKFHSLGDYLHTIQRFGTTDSYSTQPVSFTTTALFIFNRLSERTRA
jgi:hypothetical protein